ncbi:ATP-binding cassette domain-containing protein [Saccharopolyspora dendranthemae]|uniref:ATP-binding cassette subfamily C protein n=1 Tax=Saccharopolyspora dendranthemae TaxID=1181886 RepID=A0A561V9S5_9PSEU|nr:ABC transporter ATP-binding protein [Saccharopolyspora dendranthemae]TWG08362.1 ATP-binding cassette subfamily C protein [Saccharopolyspora dendranthemae]
MTAEEPQPSGVGLVLPVLRAERRALGLLLMWSLLGVTPVLLSGRLIAFAMDRGFLAGSGAIGLGALIGYGLAMVLGTLANRQAVSHMAAIVEPLRDHLLRWSVRGGLHGVVRSGQDSSTGAVSRITTQVEKVRQILSGLLLSASSVGFTLVAALIGVLTLAPVVGLLMVPVLAAAGLAVAGLSRVWKRRYERSLAAEEELGACADEVLNGLRDVLACDARERAFEGVERVSRADARASAAVGDVGGLRAGVVGLGARAPLVLLLVLAPWLVSSGQLTPGELLGAATYLVSGLEPALRTLVQTVGNMGLELGTVLGRLARYGAIPDRSPGGSMALDRFELELAQVTFRYGPHSRPVLNRADLRIEHGEHVVIVGPSGIGKSTLVSVLTGLEPVESGEVRLGGLPLTSLREPWLRSTVALIPQQTYVFAGTVRENLCYLAPDATDDELAQTVLALGLDELVSVHGGLDGELTSGALSEGERQLVALARVHLSPARIVVLDEATCHLDAYAEARAERAFARRPGTLIVIAHRISSAQRSQRVLMLDENGLQSGTHGTLLRRSSTYANLVGAWNRQHRGRPSSGITPAANSVRRTRR